MDVSHCHGARAVSFTFPNGFKFSYSGDCRPSAAFTRIGARSTVLLHEATFDDVLQGDAIAKKHSTITEALDVGAAMGARCVLLTHFSQRYQKVPVMDDFANADGTPPPRSNAPQPRNGVPRASRAALRDMKVAVAFDYMRIKTGEIQHMEHFTPALLKLYETAGDGPVQKPINTAVKKEKGRGPK